LPPNFHPANQAITSALDNASSEGHIIVSKVMIKDGQPNISSPKHPGGQREDKPPFSPSTMPGLPQPVHQPSFASIPEYGSWEQAIEVDLLAVEDFLPNLDGSSPKHRRLSHGP
jgi:hypothetical protein